MLLPVKQNTLTHTSTTTLWSSMRLSQWRPHLKIPAFDMLPKCAAYTILAAICQLWRSPQARCQDLAQAPETFATQFACNPTNFGLFQINCGKSNVLGSVPTPLLSPVFRLSKIFDVLLASLAAAASALMVQPRSQRCNLGHTGQSCLDAAFACSRVSLLFARLPPQLVVFIPVVPGSSKAL